MLMYKVYYSDGGEQSKKYSVANLLSPSPSVYCSASVSVANIVLKYAGKGRPLLTHIVLRVPRAKYDSPVRTAAVFASGLNVVVMILNEQKQCLM